MKAIDIQSLACFFEQRRDIRAAVLFGSSQGGVIPEGGDVDVGVLYSIPPDTNEKLALLAEISERVGHDEVDIVDLDKAPPFLAFEAIRGKWLCRNNPDETAALCSRVSREYEDGMAQIDRQRQLHLKC